jgi:hypothetical protein
MDARIGTAAAWQALCKRELRKSERDPQRYDPMIGVWDHEAVEEHGEISNWTLVPKPAPENIHACTTASGWVFQVQPEEPVECAHMYMVRLLAALEGRFVLLSRSDAKGNEIVSATDGVPLVGIKYYWRFWTGQAKVYEDRLVKWRDSGKFTADELGEHPLPGDFDAKVLWRQVPGHKCFDGKTTTDLGTFWDYMWNWRFKGTTRVAAWDDALRQLEVSIVDAYKARGNSDFSSGNFDAAETAYAHGLLAFPGSRSTSLTIALHGNRAECLLRLPGRAADAQQAAEAVLLLEPNNAKARVRHFKALVQQQTKDSLFAAVADLDELRQLLPVESEMLPKLQDSLTDAHVMLDAAPSSSGVVASSPEVWKLIVEVSDIGWGSREMDSVVLLSTPISKVASEIKQRRHADAVRHADRHTRTYLKCGHCRAKLRPESAHCKACKTVIYCGKGCQKAHWPVHKAACKAEQKRLQKGAQPTSTPLPPGLNRPSRVRIRKGAEPLETTEMLRSKCYLTVPKDMPFDIQILEMDYPSFPSGRMKSMTMIQLFGIMDMSVLGQAGSRWAQHPLFRFHMAALVSFTPPDEETFDEMLQSRSNVGGLFSDDNAHCWPGGRAFRRCPMCANEAVPSHAINTPSHVLVFQSLKACSVEKKELGELAKARGHMAVASANPVVPFPRLMCLPCARGFNQCTGNVKKRTQEDVNAGIMEGRPIELIAELQALSVGLSERHCPTASEAFVQLFLTSGAWNRFDNIEIKEHWGPMFGLQCEIDDDPNGGLKIGPPTKEWLSRAK